MERESVHEAMRTMLERAYTGSELQVGSIPLLIQRMHLPVSDGRVSELYGMKVIEKEWMPKDHAVLVDQSGTVLKVFRL